MSSKCFVGSLAWEVNDEDLRSLFASVGEVVEAKVIMDRDTGRSRGFGFVTMGGREDAQRCIAELDGADLRGRSIKVNEAEEKGGRGGRGGDRGGRGRGNDRGRAW